MIIRTKRPASILIVDTVITAAAWLAFIYQFTKGVVFLLSERPGAPLSSIFGVTLSPTAITLLTCLIVCLFNAMLIYIWAHWQRRSHSKARRNLVTQTLLADALADHFSLSPQQLDDVQDSRVTVVYHSPSGGITHLETSDLQLQNVPSVLDGTQQESELQVA